MRRRLFISILFAVVLSLSACGGQEITPLSPTLPSPTETPVITAPPPATDTPAPTATTASSPVGTSKGNSYSPDDKYDYSYGNTPSETDSGLPVTGGNSIQSQNGPFGTMLVDANGKTLYIFLKDTQGANASACSALCADNWPALTAASAGEGVDASLLGSFQRADGSTQVTFNGWPLYYFAGDRNPGDTNGQGLSGNWYVVSPAGEAIR